MTFRTDARPFAILIASLMFVFVINTSAWADECDDARLAASIAEEEWVSAYYKSIPLWDEESAALNEMREAQQALGDANREARLAYLVYTNAWNEAENARQQGSSNWDRFRENAEWQAYQAALAEREQALADYRAARATAQQAKTAFDLAVAKVEQIGELIEISLNELEARERIWRRAQDRVKEACESETPELERLLDEFGMNDGSGVVEEYAGRAREANTEDIAIERARQMGLDGQGPGAGGGAGMGAGSPANFCAPGSAGCSTLNFKVVDSSQPGNSTSYQLGGTSVAMRLTPTQEQTIVIGVPTGTPLTLAIACAGTNNAGALSCITSIVVNSGGSCTNNVTTTALNATNTTTTCTGS